MAIPVVRAEQFRAAEDGRPGLEPSDGDVGDDGAFAAFVAHDENPFARDPLAVMQAFNQFVVPERLPHGQRGPREERRDSQHAQQRRLNAVPPTARDETARHDETHRGQTVHRRNRERDVATRRQEVRIEHVKDERADQERHQRLRDRERCVLLPATASPDSVGDSDYRKDDRRRTDLLPEIRRVKAKSRDRYFRRHRSEIADRGIQPVRHEEWRDRQNGDDRRGHVEAGPAEKMEATGEQDRDDWCQHQRNAIAFRQAAHGREESEQRGVA